jgi:hypothetical protein
MLGSGGGLEASAGVGYSGPLSAQSGMHGNWGARPGQGFPQTRPGEGQRRNKVKQRGRENVTGLAAPSRQQKSEGGGGGGAGRFTRIRVRMSGLKPLEKSSKGGGGGDTSKKSSKKRTTKVAACAPPRIYTMSIKSAFASRVLGFRGGR